MEQLRQRVIRISDWINGRVDDALAATGASLQPVSAEAFRAAQQEQPFGAKARLAIPLGLDGNQQIVSGDAVASCIEQFQLELLPLDSGDGVSALLVRLSAATRRSAPRWLGADQSARQSRTTGWSPRATSASS